MSHDSTDFLLQKIYNAKQRVQVGDRFYHYKSPNQFYIVREIALAEATQEVVVVYEAEYAPGVVWVRPLENFLEVVEIGKRKICRFTKM